ncbi:Uncharacterized protein BP5553_01318 [Venustampulla echinocandica]|uniref:Rhodopsin domain-containing protein n=1 Tax=Venustampulla echinocandica TaxID=2656787 RepID=A0A370U0N3_9HELO|nr:Uncharacterized protein BP5553_01318 [Venustampulla echinocandica]RDL41339.1 Uncharacterized protein BP5553_01318 [Venustampulla echinocandica]
MAGDPLPSGGIAIIVVNTVFLVLAFVAVIARFYARYLQRKQIATDDYLIVAGLFFTVATVGIGYSLVLDGGAGRHMEDATPEQIAMALKLFVPAPLLWAIATTFVKLSILFFYISIFTMPRLRSAVYVVIAVSVALVVVVILESFLLCRPFEYTWNRTIPGVCGDTQKAYLSVAIVNLAIDLSIVALPMPVLWSLKMAKKKKMAISAILCLGLCICAITAARIQSVLNLDPMDFTYTVVEDTIFGGLELELGIINACLPILRPLFSKAFGSNSALASIWTRKTENDSTDKSKTNWSSQKESKRFHRLNDDTYPLTDLTTTTIYANNDVESQVEQGRDVMIKKDVHVYTTNSHPMGR